MIDKDYIKKTFGYLDNLLIEGWIWEFVRRNIEFRTICESIRDLSSTVQVSRLSNNNMFRIEMPPVLANKLTEMEDKFGLRPNIEMKSSLVPPQFTTIDKTLFVGISLNANRREILDAIGKLLMDAKIGAAVSRPDTWKDYLIVYDLRELKHKGIDKTLSFSMIAKLLSSVSQTIYQ
jgi:hypothetical protein